jgi:selenocysteine lyase/cysteine desulfurase
MATTRMSAPRAMIDPSVSSLFQPAAGLTYMDAASYGLPPTPAVEAMDTALREWRAGTGRWVDDWDRPADGARADFASLVGARAAEVALIPTVSVGMSLVAGSLKHGDVVVVPEDEHVSDLFPLLVAEERGVVIRQVPFAGVAEAITEDVTLAAFSIVQMQTGRVADLASIRARAADAGARIFVDATHAAPFVSIAEHIGGIDYLVCAAYKHLLGARGSSFMYVREDRVRDITPTHANWRGAVDPFLTFFGGPLTLADDASRFNVSLAWLPWVGTTASLPLVVAWQRDGTLEAARSLADVLYEAVGLKPRGSSLVCLSVSDTDAARAALDADRIKASVRGGAIRFSVHVWNTIDDVDRAATAIRPFLRRS